MVRVPTPPSKRPMCCFVTLIYFMSDPEFLYEYDFGDGWMHLIEFESTRPIDPDINYPICIAGARHGPPEDVGGVRKKKAPAWLRKEPADAFDWHRCSSPDAAVR